MTANDLITSALQLLGVLAETESASAEQADVGLSVLNDMMADLAADGIDVGYAPTDTVTTDIGIPQESRNPIKYLLAVFLAPIYGRDPPAVVVALATTGRARLLREAIYKERQESTMAHVPLGYGRYRTWDIDRGF